MKKNRTLFYGLLGFMAIGLAVSSCNDEFSEEDLLRLQQDLADERNEEARQQAIDALDQAGAFYSFTIALNNDDNFVEGASVTLHGQADGDVTQTTNANGATTFTSVRSGGNIVTISAAGFASAVLNIFLTQLQEGVNYEITPDGTYIPIPRNTSAIIPLFSIDPASGSTATIRGRVEIETDVTNTTPEVPQDIQVTAVLNLFEVNQSNQGGVSVSRYAFDWDQAIGFGVATVDNTTGEYSMMVPASAEGIYIELEVPNIEAMQRIAVGWEDGIQLVRPEYRDVLTNFGDAFSTSSIPAIRGARAVFDAPPTPGTGFTLSNFQRVPAQLFSFDLDRRSDAGLTAQEDEGSTIVGFTTLGEGYTSSPTVTITDATGSNARAEAHVEFAIGGVTVTAAGTGYGAADVITMNFIGEQRLDDGTTADTPPFASLNVTADGNGNIGQTEVSAAVDNAITNGTLGFDASSPVHVTNFGTVDLSANGFTADEMEGFRVEFSTGTGTAVTGTPSVSVGRLLSMVVTDQGEDYSLPSFAFTEGGATTQAALNILAYESTWSFDLDNTNATGYTALPDDIYFEYSIASLTPSILNTSGTTNDVQRFLFGVSSGGTLDFFQDNLLTPNGSGGLAYVDQVATYTTNFASAVAPTPYVIDRTTTSAIGRIDMNSTTNEITAMTVFNSGQGYEDEFNVIIEPSAIGAPGSGALFNLEGGSLSGGIFSWFGTNTMLSAGSGYLNDLNQINTTTGDEDFQFTSGSSSVTVRTGDVVVSNINYGTGQRQINVNGNWTHYPN